MVNPSRQHLPGIRKEGRAIPKHVKDARKRSLYAQQSRDFLQSLPPG